MKTPFIYALVLFFFLYVKNTQAQSPEIILQRGHTGSISATDISPDAAILATGSPDKTVILWDVQTGKQYKTLYGHSEGVTDVAFTSDGKYLISTSAEKEVFVWNVETEKLEKKLAGHEGGAQVILASSDPNKIWTGGNDSYVRQWDVAAGTQTAELKPFNGEIEFISVMPGDESVAMVASQSKVYYWNLETQAQLGKWTMPPGLNLLAGFTDFKFSPDGSYFITGFRAKAAGTGGISVNTVDKEDYKDFKPAASLSANTEAVFGEFSPDGKYVIMADGKEIKFFKIEDVLRPAGSIFSAEVQQYYRDMMANGAEEKLLRGHTKNITDMKVSKNGKFLLSVSEDNTLRLWDMQSGRQFRVFQGFGDVATCVTSSADGNLVYVGYKNTDAKVWDLTTGAILRSVPVSYNAQSMAATPDGKYLLLHQEGKEFFQKVETRTGKVVRTYRPDKAIESLGVSEDGQFAIVYLESGAVKKWDLTTNKEEKVSLKEKLAMLKNSVVGGKDGEDGTPDFDTESGGFGFKFTNSEARVFQGTKNLGTISSIGHFTDATVSLDGKNAYTTDDNGVMTMWELPSLKKIATFVALGEYDYVSYTPDFYYTGSKYAALALAFRDGKRIVPYDQYDLMLNRPDKIIKRLGKYDDRTLGLYETAYQKRLKKAGVEKAELDLKKEAPELILNLGEQSLKVNEQDFAIRYSVQAKTIPISSMEVTINGVPVNKGLMKNSFPDQAKNLKSNGEILVKLNKGTNFVRVKAINEEGVSSFIESFEVTLMGDARPKLYVLSIGVSKYKQSKYNLNFAARDAFNIAGVFDGRDIFSDVEAKVLADENATKANILAARSFLEKATIDDIVLIFIAGHGLLDDNLDYVFACHDIDFTNPTSTGLLYPQLEDMLNSSKARKKVLMMDTCHSGEVEKEEVKTVNMEEAEMGDVAFRAVTNNFVYYEEGSRGSERIGLKNANRLAQSIFTDISNDTGANIIAAAAGTEFALEGVDSPNGLFTSAVLMGLQRRKADQDNDRKITLLELQKFVGQEVREKSGGMQQPTSRAENINNDFRVF